MPIVLSLPPELLLDILSLSIPKAPSRSRLQYLVRQNQLRSFSVVHRSWTHPAQELLRQDVWIKVMCTSKRKLEKLNRMSGAVPSTRYLGVVGPLQQWSEMRRKIQGLEHVVTIRHTSDEKSNLYRQIAVYAEYRYLEVLHLDLGKYHTEPCKPEMTFHKLERLTLGKILVSNWPKNTISEHVFNPNCMPKLKHLALYHVDYFELVSAVLPQITTLAIIGSHSTRHLTFLSLTDALPRLVELKHLCLAGYNSAIPQLFGRSQGSQFESLHLGIYALEHLLEVASLLVDIVKQQRKECKNGKIVIYGSNQSLIEKLRTTAHLDLLEWRENEDSVPFENFAGQ